jgi:nucleoside-diphosphate-sugar epimerase
MSAASDTLASELRAVCGERLALHVSGADEITAEVASADLLAIAQLLRDAPTLQFAMLMDVAGVDYLDYGRTEWQAEQALARIGGMEVAIVRSPLVYGAGVKGNLLELLRLADSSLPLPFAGIDNRRSFVHVDDLARLLVECAALPAAAGGTFMAAHPDCFSTTHLAQTIRRFLGVRPRLFHVPAAVLEGLAALGGQGAKMRRLTRSLEIDASETQRILGWTPQIAFETSVEDMVRAYRESLG